MSKYKEENAIANVECPQCHATPGKLCYFHGHPTKWLNGRRYVHPERIQANQALTRAAERAMDAQIKRPR